MVSSLSLHELKLCESTFEEIVLILKVMSSLSFLLLGMQLLLEIIEKVDGCEDRAFIFLVFVILFEIGGQSKDFP